MPFDPALITSPFRMQPGLSRLGPGQQQLTPNQPGDAILAAKMAVLNEHPHQALCRLPAWDDCPALAAIANHAASEQPAAWNHQASDDRQTARYSATALGWSIDGNAIVGTGPPAIGACLSALPEHWRLAGLLCLAFAEDFAVIDASSGAGGRIPWLAVCLPSHWAPESKLGKSFAEVHAPVADNQALLRAADALSQLVLGPLRWQRHVWTLVPDDSLDGHPLRHPAPNWPDTADVEAIGSLAWLRTEHQTFIPVAGQAQAVFTIKVEMHKLAELASDPISGAEICRALHAAIVSMSDSVLRYRRLDSARERLLEWLAKPADRTAA